MCQLRGRLRSEQVDTFVQHSAHTVEGLRDSLDKWLFSSRAAGGEGSGNHP